MTWIFRKSLPPTVKAARREFDEELDVERSENVYRNEYGKVGAVNNEDTNADDNDGRDKEKFEPTRDDLVELRKADKGLMIWL